MANTGLSGPFVLTDDEINRVITKESPGVYALGHKKSDGTFVVSYVGRSDDDLNGRLHKWVGKKNYEHFKASYFSSPKAAFEKECTVYHDFGGADGKMDNDIHPARPENANWECPSCTIFD